MADCEQIKLPGGELVRRYDKVTFTKCPFNTAKTTCFYITTSTVKGIPVAYFYTRNPKMSVDAQLFLVPLDGDGYRQIVQAAEVERYANKQASPAFPSQGESFAHGQFQVGTRVEVRFDHDGKTMYCKGRIEMWVQAAKPSEQKPRAVVRFPSDGEVHLVNIDEAGSIRIDGDTRKDSMARSHEKKRKRNSASSPKEDNYLSASNINGNAGAAFTSRDTGAINNLDFCPPPLPSPSPISGCIGGSEKGNASSASSSFSGSWAPKDSPAADSGAHTNPPPPPPPPSSGSGMPSPSLSTSRGHALQGAASKPDKIKPALDTAMEQHCLWKRTQQEAEAKKAELTESKKKLKMVEERLQGAEERAKRAEAAWSDDMQALRVLFSKPQIRNALNSSPAVINELQGLETCKAAALQDIEDIKAEKTQVVTVVATTTQECRDLEERAQRARMALKSQAATLYHSLLDDDEGGSGGGGGGGGGRSGVKDGRRGPSF